MINESWRLCPWADVLYGCDGTWWKARKGVPEFQGIKLSQDTKTCVDYNVNKVTLVEQSDRILTETPSVIGCGSTNGCGNSGFQGSNIAAQFGPRRIVLVGFDLRIDRGVHWHGRHPPGLNNPDDTHMMPWRRALNGAAVDFAALGIEVINASPVSTLTAYPVMTLEEAIEC